VRERHSSAVRQHYTPGIYSLQKDLLWAGLTTGKEKEIKYDRECVLYKSCHYFRSNMTLKSTLPSLSQYSVSFTPSTFPLSLTLTDYRQLLADFVVQSISLLILGRSRDLAKQLKRRVRK
jgi:hypothetical protein